MKKFISIILSAALAVTALVMPVTALADEADTSAGENQSEVSEQTPVEVLITPVEETGDIEVGDQFLVSFELSEAKKYLSYQLRGTFDKDKATLIAPVYTNNMSVLENSFDNETGTFSIIQADLTITGCEDKVLCSFLFEALAEGEFVIELTNGENETMLGRDKRAEDGSVFYTINANSAKFEIKADSDGESDVLIKDAEPLTPYDDILGYDWAERSIGVLYRLGALENIADKSFFPAKDVTRGEFVTMLVKICELEGKETEPFADVDEDFYGYDEINTAKSLGLVKGDESGNFAPYAPITREDICTILFRTMRQMQKVRAMDNADEYLKDFEDKADISDYAKDSVAGMIRAKILIGDEGGRLNPKANMTRAEAAVVLNRVAEFNKLISL